MAEHSVLLYDLPMDLTTRVELRAPYLILLGDVADPGYAKTGFGLAHWRPELVAGQIRFPACSVDLGVPDMSVAQAVDAGVKSIVVGVAPVGGDIPKTWWKVLEQAAAAGLDVVSGLHKKVSHKDRLKRLAEESGARLVDVRSPPVGLPVASGKKRSGMRLLTVGTDCAVGKKYTALSIHKAMLGAGKPSRFKATGQTGIMIAGEGIPIDAVIADFVAGAAEVLSPDTDPSHWSIIEGQGSLFHPGYAAVTLGLLHGSQPDAFVVCHNPMQTTLGEWPEFPTPSVQECIDLTLRLGRLTNPNIRCAGISINTSQMPETDKLPYLEQLAAATGLPCVDPILQNANPIVAYLESFKP